MNEDEQRRDAQRMESVGQLTGGLAHDFNNLLTVIQGNLQALQELATVQQDPACPPLLNAALRATQRGAELTRSLLAFARRQKLAPAAIDPLAMLRSLLAMLRRTVDQRLHLELDPTPCPDCVADPVLLESALLNIALNARDAMPEGGTLSCRAAACEQLPGAVRADIAVGERPADGYVAISMRDTGSGMSQAVRERVFEPFFTTKEPGRGTGLGLSTAYGFVKQSAGAIVIESTPGIGTCVTLYLPRERRAVPRPTPPRLRSAEALRGLDVMLVEDDLEVMAVTLSFLQHMGCTVRAYGSGEHALLALEREPPPALLLSDVALGTGLRGTELARTVRGGWPQVAVLLMSGHLPEPGEIDAAWASELLAKPFSREQLGAAMLRAVDRPGDAGHDRSHGCRAGVNDEDS
jgi:CheY-like chemotaxis protein